MSTRSRSSGRRKRGVRAVRALALVCIPTLLGVSWSSPPTAAVVSCTATVPAGGTIQTAINAAAPGSTICVDAGVFNESLTINKALTLVGKQDGVDPSWSGRAGGESVISGGYAVGIGASNVHVRGFEIRNFRQGVSATGAQSNIEIAYNWIHAPNTVDFSTNILGVLLEPSSMSNVTITHNIVSTDYSGKSLAGIGLSSAGAPATITNLTITENEVTSSRYGIFDGADPAQYLIDGAVIDRNWIHNTMSAFNIGNIAPSGSMAASFSGNLIEDTGGTIGMQNGTISGNTFRNGARMNLWGTVFGFTRPSTNVQIVNNDYADPVNGRGILIDSYAGSPVDPVNGPYYGLPSIDASTIHIHANAFRDLAPGYRLRNWGLNAADATLNWWGAATGPTAAMVEGSATTAPWIATYSDDPTHVAPTTWPLVTAGLTGTLGFWPLVPTTTAISTSSPDPSVKGTPTTVTGTLAVTGLGGVTSSFATLPGQVGVADGTDACTDTTVTGSATPGTYDFSCDVTLTSGGSRTLTATYSDTSTVPLYATSSATQIHQSLAPENVAIRFDGELYDADGNGTTVLTATLLDSYCADGVATTFRLTATDGTIYSFGAVSNDNGVATTTVSLPYGVYEVMVSATDTALCTYNAAVATAGVLDPKAASNGGGWYKAPSSPPRVNFGYTVDVKVDRRAKTTTVSGQLLWINTNRSRLKGAVTGYLVPVTCPSVEGLAFARCARVLGTGTLSRWDTVNGGWIDPQPVTFEAWVADGGTASLSKKGGPKTAKPDAFGITIAGASVPAASAPVQLSGGNVTVG